MKIILVVVLLTLGYLYGMSKLETIRLIDLSKIPTTQQGGGGTITNPASTLTISIAGEVLNPGKYTVSKGISLAELIVKAGGLSDKADEEAYNVNYQINDLTSIYIPSENGGNKISINSANASALGILPGIGDIIAQRIIDYRVAHGSFNCIDDIRKVSGIGDTIFTKIRELIRL